MKVSELMTKDPVCVTPDTTVREAATEMERCDCGCLPVIDSGNSGRLLGVVTDRDIAMRAVGHGYGPDTRVQEVMTKNPSCCHEDDDIAVVESIMADEQVRRVVVVDATGHGIGMVSQADLARAAEQRSDVSDRQLARVVECVSKPSREVH